MVVVLERKPAEKKVTALGRRRRMSFGRKLALAPVG